MITISLLKKELRSMSNPRKAKILARFFKTKKGDYGEGDIFLGVTVPESRYIAKKYATISRSHISKLLKSKIHEERLIALLILVSQFNSGNENTKKIIYNFYLKNTHRINNWDLVDLTADKIVGVYLFRRSRAVLVKLTHSKNLWERRIAIIATFHFIKNNETHTTFEVAKILLNDKHDLIHKATGWMLREVGKRVSLHKEKMFLNRYAHRMPRTMLRYAIERMATSDKQKYLSKK